MIINTPRPAVSRDGASVSVALGTDVTLVDVGDGSRRVVKAPITASIVALSPTGGHIPAVAGGFELAWLSEATPSPVIQLPGRAVSARVSDGGTVVVVTRSDSQGTRLCAYAGADLAEVFKPVALGHASVHVVELDSDASVVMAGLNRERASETGQHYLRQVGWTKGHASITWGGDGVPNDVELARASGGHLVVVRGKQIITSTIAALATDGEIDGETSDIGGEIETIAISPDGLSVCIVVGGDNGLHVQSRRFDQARVVDRGSVPHGLDNVEAAIDDDGTLVVVGLRSATQAVIAVASPDGRLEESWQIDQPRSVFRDNR